VWKRRERQAHSTGYLRENHPLRQGAGVGCERSFLHCSSLRRYRERSPHPGRSPPLRTLIAEPLEIATLHRRRELPSVKQPHLLGPGAPTAEPGFATWLACAPRG
jgi:hypothetical protein